MALPRLVLNGCPRCIKGALALEDIRRKPNGKLEVEYNCIQCGNIIRRRVRPVGQEEGGTGTITSR